MIKIFFKILFIFLMLYKTVFSEDLNTVEILSDELEWNEKEKIAYARGNASAQNKEKKLLAKELVVYLSEANEIILIKASENVFFYSPKDEATGDQATYDLLKDIIIITGNVKLKREENIMHGEHLELDLVSGISKLSKGEDKEKVRMLFSTANDNESEENGE
jgi:lipopolysaccharide export system protein LptA